MSPDAAGDGMVFVAPVIVASLFVMSEWQSEPPPPQEIVGGTDCSACDFPSSVFIGSGGGFNCTASLVHPRVIVTANHCLGSIYEAGFGESAYDPAFTVGVEYCQGHDWFDLAFCVLSEDAPDVGIVPVIMGCEVEELVPGKEIHLAGFGQSDEASGSGGGTKRWTTNTVDAIDYDYGSIYLNGSGTGSCFGDSGGPAFVQLSDGTWRVIAAVQGPHPDAPPLGCGHGGTYTLIHTEMDWIESTSGIDITPCFDADGTWNPGEGCEGFPKQVRGFGGSWGAMCDGAMRAGASATCGEGTGEPEPPGSESGGAGESGGGTGDFPGGEHPTSDGGELTSDGGEPTSEGGGQGEDGASEDEDEDEDPSATPGSLPPNYGRHPAIAGCRVGGSDARWLAWFVLAFSRRRRAT